MKRLLVSLLAAVSMLALNVPPASAAATYRGKVCKEWFSPNDARSLKVCASIMDGDGGPVWSRLELWTGSTGVAPYMTKSYTAGVRFMSWNATNSCEGRWPACNGGGNGDPWGPFYSMPDTYATARQLETDHFAANEHLCVTTVPLVEIYIKWYSGDANTYKNFNGSDNFNSYPNCTS